METYKHSCIKCGATYDSNDPDPYYCSPCEEAKKAIAREVDAKMRGRLTKDHKSELAMFDEIAKSKGGPRNNFVNIKDLGISL